MPGLSFACDFDRERHGVTAKVLAALDSVCHDQRYRRSVLVDEDSYWLAATAYPEYPVASFELDDVVANFEGRIYGPQSTQEALADLAQIIFAGHDGDVGEWLRRTDGEFVGVFRHRPSGQIAIVNDLLGRLPLYRHRTASTLLVSRELRLIARLLPTIRFDKMAMAQQLAVCFPLGSRTLLEGVERVPAATCIRVDVQNRTISESILHSFDFSTKDDPAKSRRDVASELASLFSAACRSRAASNADNVLSLSGGADSRSVAAGLQRNGIRFRCASFLDTSGDATTDVRVARQLVAALGITLDIFRIAAPRPADHLNLLRRKSGMNPLSMSSMVSYLEQVEQRYGAAITFLTGDGGDKLLLDLRPPRVAESDDDATWAFLRTHQVLPLDAVSALTGLSSTEIFAEVRARFDAAPEEDRAQKRVHLEIRERAFKALFEGEDRNRSFFWSTTPFYSIPFFTASMRCPDDVKGHRALYAEFLREISPTAATVEYAGLGVAVDSAAFRTKAKAASLLSEYAANYDSTRLVERRDPHPHSLQTAAHIRRQMTRCKAISDWLDLERQPDYVERLAVSSPNAAHGLLTLTSLIEDLTLGASWFEDGAEE